MKENLDDITHVGMRRDAIELWVKKNTNKSIYVMVRIDFERSIPLKITSHELYRFLNDIEFVQTRISPDGHLYIGV